MPAQAIRLVVVDDHDIMRQGLVRLLQHEADLDVVGLAKNGSQAIALALQERPDVILMDIVMDDMGGLEATREILAELPDSKVIMLTMYEEKAFLQEARAAGAAGYFLKGSDSAELANTIRVVHQGGTYFSPKLADDEAGPAGDARSAAEPFQNDD